MSNSPGFDVTTHADKDLQKKKKIDSSVYIIFFLISVLLIESSA